MDQTTTGVLGGAASGASIGSVAGPWGMAIGAVAGGIYGGIQGNEAKKAKEKADRAAAQIPREDPAMAQYLGDMRRQRRHLLAGTASLFSQQQRAIEQAQAQTGANLARTTGGSSGTLIDALLRSQGQTNSSLGEAFGQQEMLAGDSFNRQLPVIGDMADRRLSLDTYGRDLAMMRAATLEQANNANFSGGLANMSSLMGGTPKTATPVTQMQWDAAQRPMMNNIPSSLTQSSWSAPASGALTQAPLTYAPIYN